MRAKAAFWPSPPTCRSHIVKTTSFSGHVTVSRLARDLESYPAALFALARINKVRIVEAGGAACVAEADIPRMRELWQAHRARPRLSRLGREPRRRNRMRSPWPSEPSSGSTQAITFTG